MTLEHCKVCGSLTITESEICLICGYPRKGRTMPRWVKFVAFFLVLIFTLPVILSFFYKIDFEEFKRRKKHFEPTEITSILINERQ